ncbi:MAG: GNAT family N-acetyltransferase [Clostridia bacterium]|nr:GNAT family N-acetyltransferase [Clostridia bacterium]
MENYRILSVKYEDLPECVNTIREAFKANAEKFGFTKENYPSSGAFIELEDLQAAKARGVHMYAAWIENTKDGKDKIIGYVQLEKKDPETYSFQKFAVLPEYQSLGVGRMLIAFCRNKAITSGAKKIKLIMVYDNKKLLNTYEMSGFKLVGTKRDDKHPFLQGIMEMDLTK